MHQGFFQVKPHTCSGHKWLGGQTWDDVGATGATKECAHAVQGPNF